MGKYIHSKKEYEYEMKKGGYVPYEEGCRAADSVKKTKEYIPSEKGVSVVKAILEHGDKKGNIVLGQHPRLVKAMEESGVKFNTPDWCPSVYKEGSFK
jgi:hypothetical protein